MTQSEKPGIEDAIAAAGGQVKLAEALGVSQQAISLWARQGYAPNSRIVALEALFGIPRARLIDPRIANLVDQSSQLRAIEG